jgi:hypothetical protein
MKFMRFPNSIVAPTAAPGCRTLLASLTAVTLLFAALAASRATTITAWNFENNSIAANNSPAPSTGTGTAVSIGMNLNGTAGCDVLQGVSGDTGANGIADTSQIWRVRSTTGGNGWTSTAGIGTQGAQFSASTVGYNNIVVTFDWYCTTKGEAKLQFQYTTDGSTWKNLP